MEYMYKFNVKWYNEVDNNVIVSKGIVAATGYHDAAQKLVSNFDEDNILDMGLTYIVDTENGINVEQEDIVDHD